MALDIFGNVKQIFKSPETARNTFYWPDNLKQSNVVWRLPRHVCWNDNIIVREDEFAVFLRDGKALHVFDRPDRYALTTQNVPVLATIGKMITGVEQIGEVYWVQKREFRGEFSSHDKTTLTYRDVDFGLVRIFASGKFAYKITEPLLFITQFIGTKGLQHTDEIISWLQDQIMMTLNSSLGKLKQEKQMAVLDMPANLSEIEQMCLSKLSNETQQYGLQVTKFSGLAIKLPEEVQKSIDKRSSMSVVGVNYMQFQTGQALEGFGDGAAKGGASSDAASMIAAIVPGANVGSVMSQTMIPPLQATPGYMINNPVTSGPRFVCQKCRYQTDEITKFCPMCGNPMIASGNGKLICPSCNSNRIRPGERYCPDCGTPIVNTCSKCTSNLKPGVKFCPNCGEPVLNKS